MRNIEISTTKNQTSERLMKKNKVIILKMILTFCISLTTGAAFSEENEKQFGRYLTVNQEQKSLVSILDMPIQREFPKSVETVGQAVEYTLKGTGYHLLTAEHSSPDLKALYAYELPLSERKILPTTLKAGLLKLVGQAYQIVLDPVHRQVTFKVRQNYNKL